MHFITFPVASTNIFPLVNSKQGGQLVTEFNLKAREMVATNPDIQYAVGPSFIHSMEDFKIKLLEDPDVEEYDATKTYIVGNYCSYENTTYICITAVTEPEEFDPEKWRKTAISTSILQIGPGRAVINGHYVETLAPMQIDLNLANKELKQLSRPELSGNLSIGIKSYFSTEATMAGSMLVENTDNMYVGVQLVITNIKDFKVPGDEGCKTVSEQGNATADIKLADFTYANGVISASSIKPNQNAIRYIDSKRIYDFDSLLDDKYVSAENLVDRMFYTYSGKSGWCDSTGSLMVWDAHPEQHMSTSPTPDEVPSEAQFYIDANDNVHLIIPHKQQDAEILNDNGDRVYYQPRVLDFPTADYNASTPGIVTKKYTQTIKDIAAKLNLYKEFTNGKQLGFIDVLSADETGKLSYEFPKDLTGPKFQVGDYYIVREDYTVVVSEDTGIAPATMYFVLPGGVEAITFNDTTQPSGIRLGNAVLWEGDGVAPPSADNPDPEELINLFEYTTFSGIAGEDYFEIVYHNMLDNTYTSYYYVVSSTGPKHWSSAVLLTGGVPLATEDMIGGFYNASTDNAYMDAGYVYLDDTGHLRLRDYALLRAGALAYQLGADFRVPAGQTLEYMQGTLDEYVNARVAFYTQGTSSSSSLGSESSEEPIEYAPPVVEVEIPLPAGESGTLNIYNIDSRFGTCVKLNFTTNDIDGDYSGIIINIFDCQKIRIDSSVTILSSGPMINVFRSCLYYDASVIDYIRTCDTNGDRSILFPEYTNFSGFDNLTLWYARFYPSEPELVVNGMEVVQSDVAMVTQDISFWDETVANDNHYSDALRSITLSGSGQVVACTLYVSNNSTQKDVDATSSHVIIGGDFFIPQGSKLNYPISSVTSPIMVTGTFTTAYMSDDDVNWIVTETSFTAKSGVYSVSEEGGMTKGSIAFNSKTDIVPATYTNLKDTIDGWEPGAYHIFYGGTTV